MTSKTFFKQYPIILILLPITLFITIILAITAIKLISKTEIEILVTPISSEITINGEPYKNGKHYIPNTVVDVEIKKDGFITQSFTFDATKNTKLYAYLLQEDGTYSWYEDHPEDALLLNTIGGILAKESSSAYLERYPIISKLPIIYANYDANFQYTEFRIDGGSFDNCPIDFCLKITDVTGGNREAAIKLINQSGYDANKFYILYEQAPIEPLN